MSQTLIIEGISSSDTEASLNSQVMEQLILSLRGGGADAKRREARTRKFAQMDTSVRDFSPDIKKAPETHKEVISQSESAESPIVKACERSVPAKNFIRSPKRPRFICFIGMIHYKYD